MTTDRPGSAASTPTDDGRLARRRAELRTGEAVRNVAEAAAADLLGELPPPRGRRPDAG